MAPALEKIMPITAICPECGNAVSFSIQSAGRKLPCPKCRKLIVVPEESAAIAVQNVPAPTLATNKIEARKPVEAEVETNRTQLSLPSCCVCCLGPANITRKVVYSHTRSTGLQTSEREEITFKFPYCLQCDAHATWQEGAMSSTLVMILAAFIGMMYLLYEMSFGLWGMTILAGVGTAVPGYLWWKLMKRRQPKGTSGCTSNGSAVQCDSGEEAKFRFVFSNAEYARMFKQNN